MPNLLAVEEIASNTTPRTVTLSPLSVTVLFSCLTAADRLYDWQGADGELTPAEIETVLTILGNARHELMLTQVGKVIMWVSVSPPSGCLLCDGATYERDDYPELYALLPPVFIVDADTFRVPDMRQRFSFGAATPLEVGNTGGAATVTLAESEIPSHSHSIGGAGTSVAAPGAVPVLTPSIFPGSTGNTGGGGAHNNMPPYLTLEYWIVAE